MVSSVELRLLWHSINPIIFIDLIFPLLLFNFARRVPNEPSPKTISSDRPRSRDSTDATPSVQAHFRQRHSPEDVSLPSSTDSPNQQVKDSEGPSERRLSRSTIDRSTWRLWRQLFQQVNRSIDELYRFCEEEADEELCQDSFILLTRSGRDFEKLIERMERQRRFDSDISTRSVSWEVRKPTLFSSIESSNGPTGDTGSYATEDSSPRHIVTEVVSMTKSKMEVINDEPSLTIATAVDSREGVPTNNKKNFKLRAVAEPFLPTSSGTHRPGEPGIHPDLGNPNQLSGSSSGRSHGGNAQVGSLEPDGSSLDAISTSFSNCVEVKLQDLPLEDLTQAGDRDREDSRGGRHGAGDQIESTVLQGDATRASISCQQPQPSPSLHDSGESQSQPSEIEDQQEETATAVVSEEAAAISTAASNETDKTTADRIVSAKAEATQTTGDAIPSPSPTAVTAVIAVTAACAKTLESSPVKAKGEMRTAGGKAAPITTSTPARQSPTPTSTPARQSSTPTSTPARQSPVPRSSFTSPLNVASSSQTPNHRPNAGSGQISGHLPAPLPAGRMSAPRQLSHSSRLPVPVSAGSTGGERFTPPPPAPPRGGSASTTRGGAGANRAPAIPTDKAHPHASSAAASRGLTTTSAGATAGGILTGAAANNTTSLTVSDLSTYRWHPHNK